MEIHTSWAKYFLLTFFLVTLATQTLSFGTRDVNTKHFSDAADGEECETDQANAENLEHGVMCIEGLECMDHGGHKMCMEAHDSASSVPSSFGITVLVTVIIASCFY